MPWHDHSDTSINNTAPQPVAKQKQASGSSAASSAASGISSLIGLGKGIAKKVKGSKTSATPYGPNSD